MKGLLQDIPIIIVEHDVGPLGAEEFAIRHIK